LGGDAIEMLETGLGKGAVELQPCGVIGQGRVSAGAKPGGEAAFLSDGREDKISFPRAERELLAAWLPAKFLDKQVGKIPALQEGASTLEVEVHGRGDNRVL
jgi:hypothetical protein